MIALGTAHAGNRHVTVAGGLDLLDAVCRRETIEFGDDPVKQRHGPFRTELLREFGKAHEIAEHDRGFGHTVGDGFARPLLQPFGDRFRQDIGEKGVGFGPGRSATVKA